MIDSSSIVASRSYNDQLNFHHINPFYYALMTAMQLSNIHPTNQPIRFQKYFLRLIIYLLLILHISNFSPKLYPYLIQCRDYLLTKPSRRISPFVRFKLILTLNSPDLTHPKFWCIWTFFLLYLGSFEIPNHIILVSSQVDLVISTLVCILQ